MDCEDRQAMAIDPGKRAARFLPQSRRYSSIASYTVRLGLYQHKRVESFNKTLRLPVRDYAFMYVDSLLYVGVYGKAGDGKWKRTRKAETDMENGKSFTRNFFFFSRGLVLRRRTKNKRHA